MGIRHLQEFVKGISKTAKPLPHGKSKFQIKNSKSKRKSHFLFFFIFFSAVASYFISQSFWVKTSTHL